MSTGIDLPAAAPSPAPAVPGGDHRGSPIPTVAMITTRFMELRKRRGLMIAVVGVTVGIPTVFLLIRILLHLIAPKSYGPAGGYTIYTAMSVGVLYVFGFIIAAALGATAGSVDLSEGMFRHLVVTGRSRLALYLARIPAGLAIIMPLVAIGFSIVCAVCVFAAPKTIDYDGVHVPAGLSATGFQNWAEANATTVLCRLPYDGPMPLDVPCGKVVTRGQGGSGSSVVQGPPGTAAPSRPTPAELQAAAAQIARQAYPGYAQTFRTPPTPLMIKTGLWIELETVVGFIVGLGLSSLLGQRTIAVIMMIVLELVLTPIAIRTQIPHLANLQRAVVGIATAHLEPGQLPLAFGGGGQDYRLTESTTVAVCVILGWLLGWTALGAWRMMTRDA